jgi:hypothetical protein
MATIEQYPHVATSANTPRAWQLAYESVSTET